MKTRKVAIGVVYRKFPSGIKYLLLHRAKRKDCLWSGWEVPKGGIESGESQLKAVRREVAEEAGIKKMEVVKKLDFKVKYNYPKYWQRATGFRNTVQSPFLVEVFQNPKRLSAEFDEYAWCDFRTAMKKLKWKPQRGLLEIARKGRKTIVFDLDGVLMNSKRLWVDAFNYALKRTGITLSKELVASCLGAKAVDTVKNIERLSGIKVNDALATKYARAFSWRNAHAVRPVKGARKSLLESKNAARIVLLTNTEKKVAIAWLKRFGMNVFDKMLFAENISGKESAIKSLAREFKIPVKEITYVGDMTRDVRIARSAGCKIISVPGWDSKSELKKLKPDVLVDRIGDVPRFM